jgi:hypothetical protein
MNLFSPCNGQLITDPFSLMQFSFWSLKYFWWFYFSKKKRVKNFYPELKFMIFLRLKEFISSLLLFSSENACQWEFYMINAIEFEPKSEFLINRKFWIIWICCCICNSLSRWITKWLAYKKFLPCARFWNQFIRDCFASPFM